MKKSFVILSAILLSPALVQSQIVAGGNGFLKGNLVEVGIDGSGGFEGAAWNTAAPPLAGMHYRSNQPYFGFVANPQMNAWASQDGDFFTPGTPENGWGIEIGSTAGVIAGNNCNPWDPGLDQIPGSITSYTVDGACRTIQWDGNYVGSGYNLHFTITYKLKMGDLFYSTQVAITNNGGATIPDFYYYRNVDPDNNVSAPGGEYTTTTTVLMNPTATCNKAHVSATSNLPWFSYMGFAGVGANFRVSRGGFSNRDGSDIWHGTGAMFTSGSLYADAGMALGYRIQNFTAGSTQTFKYVVILDDAAANNAINELFYFTYTGSLSGPAPTCTPVTSVASTCSGQPVTITLNATGGALSGFNWTWSPATGLSTTTGTVVNAAPTTTTTYTVTGTSPSGCFAPITQTIQVSVVPGPLATYVNPGPQCGSFNLASLVHDDANNVPGALFNFYTVPPTSLAMVGSNIYSGGTITPSSPTVYLAYYDPVLGCVDYIPINITWSSANPVVASATICNGASTTLTATGATTYTWSPATGLSSTTGASVTANPATTTTYTITGTSGPGCTGTTSATVTVNPIPTITVPNASKCPSAPGVTMTASGAATYTWSPATGLSSTTGASVIANPPATTTYTITGTSAAGCVGTTTATLTINPGITINVPPATICSGASATLTASGAATYTWSPAVGLSSTTGTSVTANPGTTTTYTVTGTSVDGCTGTTTVTVTVNPLPVVSVNSPTICAGASAALTATGAATYTWSPSTGLSATTGATVNANPASTTTYTVTGTSAAGCVGSASSTVTVNPNPVITTNNPSACAGDPAVITASGATTYTWSPATGLSSTTGASVTSTVTTTTTYTVTGTSLGCTGTATATVTMSPLLDPTVTPAGPYCQSASAAVMTAADVGGTWTASCGTCINATTGVFDPALAAVGANTVTYTIPGGCGGTNSTTINVNAVPDVVATPAGQTICSGTAPGIALTSAIAGTGFDWTVSATNVSGASNGSGAGIAQTLTSTLAPGGNAVYTVTPTSPAGCVGTPINVTINVEEVVISNIATTDALCAGSTDGTITITATGASEYSIDNGTTFLPTNVFNVGAGTYNIVVQNANGCQATGSATINEPLPLSVLIGQDSISCSGACDGKAYAFPLDGTAPYTFSWSVAGTGSVSFVDNLCDGTYTITVTDDHNCTATASTTIVDPAQVVINTTPTVQPTCNGYSDGSMVINATNATQYSINNGGTFQASNSFGSLAAGIYDVVVKDNDGCTASTTVTINQPTPLNIGSSADASICIGSSATVSASGTGGTAPYTYTWDNGLPSGSTHTVSPGVTTVYNVSMVDANGCGPVTESVTVSVNAPLQVETSPNPTICPGAMASISALATGGGAPYTYTWTNTNNSSIIVSQSGDVSPTASAMFTVTVTDACGTPAATDTMMVFLHTLPAVNYTADNHEGCQPVVVNFNNLTANAATTEWDFGDGTSGTGVNTQHVFNDPGCYDIAISVTTNDGCVVDSVISNMICVYPMPVADFTFAPVPADVFNPEITFTNLSITGDQYSWDFAGLGNSGLTDPVFDFPADSGGVYNVCLTTVTDHNCQDSVCKEVTIQDQFLIYVPNTFTPDGDGINELFLPRIQGENPESYEFMIFNRWGEIIFQTTNTDAGWDGTHKGIKVKEDVYVWKIKVKKKINQDKLEFHGTVNVLR